MIKCLPCPCCGNTKLYTGSMSSDSMGVHCMSGGEDFVNSIMLQQGKVKIDDPYLQGCGLRMVVSVPTEYPKNFPKHLTGMKACERLRKMALEEAVSRWNQRGLKRSDDERIDKLRASIRANKGEYHDMDEL